LKFDIKIFLGVLGVIFRINSGYLSKKLNEMGIYCRIRVIDIKDILGICNSIRIYTSIGRKITLGNIYFV